MGTYSFPRSNLELHSPVRSQGFTCLWRKIPATPMFARFVAAYNSTNRFVQTQMLGMEKRLFERHLAQKGKQKQHITATNHVQLLLRLHAPTKEKYPKNKSLHQEKHTITAGHAQLTSDMCDSTQFTPTPTVTTKTACLHGAGSFVDCREWSV